MVAHWRGWRLRNRRVSLWGETEEIKVLWTSSRRLARLILRRENGAAVVVMRAAASVAHRLGLRDNSLNFYSTILSFCRTCSQRGPTSTPSLGRRVCQEDRLQVYLPLHQQQTPLHRRTTRFQRIAIRMDQQIIRSHQRRWSDLTTPHRDIAMRLHLGFSRSHQGPRAQGYLFKISKDLIKTTASFPTLRTLSTSTSKGFPQHSMFSEHSLQQHNPRYICKSNSIYKNSKHLSGSDCSDQSSTSHLNALSQTRRAYSSFTLKNLRACDFTSSSFWVLISSHPILNVNFANNK